MANRTIVIGDIHGDLGALTTLWDRLPALDADDTIVFLGDYIDRGPDSAGVVNFVRTIAPTRTPAKIVALRGNHEDAWVRVVDEGWEGFVMVPGNGTYACVRSFLGLDEDARVDGPFIEHLFKGTFFPPEVLDWMRSLPYFYEDQHGIYVHAGLPKNGEGWTHPRDVEDPQALMWSRDENFFLQYTGKIVVVGHTGTSSLPQDESQYTPDDPDDLYWAGSSAYGIDTRCGKGGFLTAIELPSFQVYESR